MSEALNQTLASYVQKLQSHYPEYRFENGNRAKFGDTDKEGILFVVYPDGTEKQYMIPSILQGSVTIVIGAIERDIESYERAQSITTQSNPAYKAPTDAVIISETRDKDVAITSQLPAQSLQPSITKSSNFLVKALTMEQILGAICYAYGLDSSIADIHIDNDTVTIYNKNKIQMK